MHRSSESIAEIAGALAKAQIELITPEKSLTGTIRSPFVREGEQTLERREFGSFRKLGAATQDLIATENGMHRFAVRVDCRSVWDCAPL